MTEKTLEKTLAKAKSEFKEGLQHGIECPCCGRYGKLNKLSITRSMALVLGWMTKVSDPAFDGWIKVQDVAPKWILRSNSHAKLLHWGLIERHEAAPAANKCSGTYRPTTDGERFIEGLLRVPKYKYIYNDKVIAEGGPRITVEACLGSPFDYDLMVRRAA